MKRTLAIDLPALLQGNQCGVDVPLLHETLRNALALKNVELLLGEEDKALLSSNTDYSFTECIWKFLSEVNVANYSVSNRKDRITHAPSIIESSFSKEMQEAIYLQLCVLHVNATGDELFVGFIPRFKSKFQLSTTRDKKTKNHSTMILTNNTDLKSWIERCRPHLEQKKHGAETKSSKLGLVSPFSSYYKIGEEYAEDLLQKAYLESNENDEFPHYLYTWDAESSTYVEFRHENHPGDSHHDYHGRDLSKKEYEKVPQHIRSKYHK